MTKNSTTIHKIGACCIALLIAASSLAQTGVKTPPSTTNTKATKTTVTPPATPAPATTPTTVTPATKNTPTPTGTTTPAKPNTTTTPGTPSTGTTTGSTTNLNLVKQTLVYNGGKVYLNWVVPSNSPDCIYVIERSTDGVEFEPLGLKEGIQSPLELLYSWIDTRPIEGKTQYRIKRVNNDGEVTALSSSSDITTPAPSPLMRDNTNRAAFAK